MLQAEKIEELIQQLGALLPEDVRRTRQDLEQNFRALLRSWLASMDLVTREEFDIQRELLANTRALLDTLEQRLAALEADTSQKH